MNAVNFIRDAVSWVFIGLATISIYAAFVFVKAGGANIQSIRDVVFACFCILVAILIQVWRKT